MPVPFDPTVAGKNLDLSRETFSILLLGVFVKDVHLGVVYGSRRLETTSVFIDGGWVNS